VTPILAVIAVQFDPLLRIGQLTIRWQTIGVTVALLIALAVAALMAPDIEAQRPFFRRGRPDNAPRFPDAPVIDPLASSPSVRPLRLDDMLLIVCGIVPGAVVGGRLIHGIDFWDVYAAAPLELLDPGVGTLSLLGAVLGGLASATYVARLIRAPVRHWADAAAVPLLLALGLGKLAQFLGGSGQGLPFDGPWAVAFMGNGPWVSTNPDLASHPSQIYEGLWLLLGIPLVLPWSGPRRLPLRVDRLVGWADRVVEPGRLFVNALGWFLLGRVIVGFTWRDDAIYGPLNTEQALALAILVGTVVGLLMRGRRRLLPAPS
jgi:prolipoprotein diacylglyceryltransferase